MIDPKENQVLALIFVAGSLFLASGASASEFPAVAGWQRVNDVRTHGPDSLWEVIDGAAEVYLSSGFKELRSCDLMKGENALTLEIYEMDSPLGAFSVFSAEGGRRADWVPISGGAFVSPPYLFVMLKGCSYVKVSVYQGRLSEEEGKVFLADVAKELPGSDALPAELEVLPVEAMIPHSQGYSKESFLGLPELSRCVWARYTDRYEKEYRLFFLLSSEDAERDSAWAKLSRDWKILHHGIHSILFRSTPYNGFAGVVRTKAGIYGVADSQNELEVVRRLERVID